MADNISAGKFVNTLDRYSLMVEDAAYVRKVKTAVLWSAVSLFYIVGGLHVASSNASTLWGISVEGVTHENFLIFLLILNLYYAVRFFFASAKVLVSANPFPLFYHIFSYKNLHKSLSGGSARFFLHSGLQDWLKTNVLKFLKDSGREAEMKEFMFRYPIFGLLENLLAPTIFPWALCLTALGFLVVKLFC